MACYEIRKLISLVDIHINSLSIKIVKAITTQIDVSI